MANNGYVKIRELAHELNISISKIVKIKKENNIGTKATVINKEEAEKIREIFMSNKSISLDNVKNYKNDEGFNYKNLRIKYIKIKNFKSYRKLKFNCNSKFNMIVGSNNIGKSTIFDSMLLWEIAYKKLITTNKTFYKPTSSNKSINITIDSLISFRIVDIEDVFNSSKEPCFITVNIYADQANVFDLRVRFDKPSNHSAYILVSISDSYSEFERFQNYCQSHKINIRNAFSIRLSQPVANIIRNEYYFNNSLVQRKSKTGYSFEVLRNKILNTMDSKRKFTYLESKLNLILGCSFKIRWKSDNRDIDVNIKLTIQDGDNKEVDLSLVGSGVLNLLEILSSLHNKSEGINFLLLDEPDSHIHSNIQSELLNRLRDDLNNSQIFIITHNDRLIHSVSNSELFYLNKLAKDNEELSVFHLVSKNFFQLKQEMAGSIEKLEKLYKDNPIIFVEGKTDKMILEEIIKIVSPNSLSKIDIQYKNGHSWVMNMILSWHYKGLSRRAIGLFDYDKSANESVNKITDTIPGDFKNFKIFKLGKFKPSHIVSYFKKGIEIPFSIEEMFDVEIWRELEEKNMLERKKDILEYNKDFDVFNKNFIEYCKDKGITDDELIYIKKVKKTEKINSAKYIVKKISDRTTNIEKICEMVVSMLEYLLEHTIEHENNTSSLEKNSSPALLNTESISNILIENFPDYDFIPEKISSFETELNKYGSISIIEFEDAIKNDLSLVEEFSKKIKLDRRKMLNPYTIVRHILYKYDSEKYDNILYSGQVAKFKKWLLETV